jgi:hypothetical protein
MQPKIDEQDKLTILKELLFPEDHGAVADISNRIQLLEKFLDDPQQFASKINPLVDQKLQAYTKGMPYTLGPTFTATLKKEISNHPEAVVETLSPILGKLIKKYTSQKIQAFFKILGRPFRFLGQWRRTIHSWFGGPSEEQLLQKELKSATIEQVLLLERRTGLLKARYSETNTMDEDKIADLCEVINRHIQTSRKPDDQHLELLPYDGYQIHLQAFVSHYVAVVISGKCVVSSRNKLQDIIFNFYYHFMARNLDLIGDDSASKKKHKTIDKTLLEEELAASFANTTL